MKILKTVQIVLIGLILISSSGCQFLGWGDSGNTNDGSQLSGSVVVPTPEARGPVYIIPDDWDVGQSDNSNPVPEPMTMLLFGPALLGLFAMYRKKKQS